MIAKAQCRLGDRRFDGPQLGDCRRESIRHRRAAPPQRFDDTAEIDRVLSPRPWAMPARLVRHPDLVDRDVTAAVGDASRRPSEIGDRPVGDLQIGRMAQPHADVLRDPARLVAMIDGDRQAAIDRVADLLEAVDDDIDFAALARRQGVDITMLDREGPRADHPVEPVGIAAAVRRSRPERQTAGRISRRERVENRPRGWDDHQRRHPSTNQPSKLSRSKSSNTISGRSWTDFLDVRLPFRRLRMSRSLGHERGDLAVARLRQRGHGFAQSRGDCILKPTEPFDRGNGRSGESIDAC